MTTRLATLGAAYSANKGAASMIQAILDSASAVGPDVAVDVLTTYPRQDEAALRAAAELDPTLPPARAVPCTPIALVTRALPLALIAGALRSVRLPWRRIAGLDPALEAMSQADAVIDIAGISYSDSRRVRFTIYGFLLNLLPWLLGRPQVKCSQAIGPFTRPITRVLARVALNRLDVTLARGPHTASYLEELGVPYTMADDLAFVMRVPPNASGRVSTLLPSSERDLIGIAPSAVVHQFCKEEGVDYVGILSRTIEDLLTKTSANIMIFAHSGSDPSLPDRLNDHPVANEVSARTPDSERITLVSIDLLPTELRALISECTVLVASRFHAMVSALAVDTPCVVVGWSHKYDEVLCAFGQEDVAIPFAELDSGRLTEITQRVLQEHEDRAKKIASARPGVARSASRNLECIAAIAGATTSPERAW